MTLSLKPVNASEQKLFIDQCQVAFQKGYEDVFGPYDKPVITRKDIEMSFVEPAAQSFFGIVDNEIVGGIVVVINEKTQRNHLDLLYVKAGCESRGLGRALWQSIESRFPQTRVWETYTPYFEKRNIHFYVNKLGFHVVEFFNEKHPNPEWPPEVGGMPLEVGRDFLRFEKVMNK